jgi:TolA-binding protein
MKSVPVMVVMLSFAVGVVLTGCSKEPTEDELLKSATRSFSEDDFDKALEGYSSLTTKFPKSDKVPEALYAMGVIYSNKKKEYAKAESIYTRLALGYPDDPTAASAAYQRARIFAQHLKKPDSAIAAYEYCLKRYPGAMSASAAQTELDELKKPSKPAK